MKQNNSNYYMSDVDKVFLYFVDSHKDTLYQAKMVK